MNPDITVYGVTDCEDTRRVREYLASSGIHFQYVNLEHDKIAEEMLKEANDGNLVTPVVVVQFGTEARKLRNPSNDELENALLDLEPLDLDRAA